MPQEIRQLGKLGTYEVSLVPRGANKKRFALRKSEDTQMDEILKAVLESDLDNEAQIDKVLKAAKLSDKAQGAIKGMVKLAAGFKDELPKDLLKLLGQLAGYEGGPVTKSEVDLDALAPEVKAQVEALWKANKEAAEKNAKLEAILKAERDERNTRDFITKAATDFGSLPGVIAVEFGPVLKAMHDADSKLAESLEKVLKAASDAIKAGELLRQAGMPSTGVSGGAWDEIKKLAAGVVQKAEKPMTEATAIDLVLKSGEGKALYQKYLAEHPRQTGGR